MRKRSTVSVCALLCVLALTACGGDDAAGGAGGASGAGAGGEAGMAGDGGTGGDSGTGGTAGEAGSGGTGGDSGTGGTGGDSGTGGSGGDDTDGGVIETDAGTDAAMPVECPLREQDNDGDGVCSLDCENYGCTHGTCDDASGTATCTCEGGYEGDHCGDLAPPPQTGLVAWFDAQNEDTLELVGAGVIKRVARWESVLDANVAFVQAEIGDQPGRPVNGINGQPAINFDGTSDFMTMEDFSGLKNATAYDIYVIATSTNDTESGAILAGVNGETGTTGAGLHGLLIEVNDTGNGLRFNHRMPFAGSGGVNLTTGTDVDLTIGMPLRFYASVDNGRLVAQRDNMQVGTVTGDVLAFNRDLDLTLGRLSGTQDMRHLKGRIGEILVYAAGQDSITSLRVRNYLKAHWPSIQ